MAEPRTSRSARSLGRHAITSVLLVLGLAGGSAVWAATTEISGAIIGGGQVVVEGGSNRVQHPEGGIVAEILVRNEDIVTAGDLLLRLDGTTVKASLEVIRSQLREAFARHARLTAESLGRTELELSPLAAGWPTDPELDRLLAAQKQLLDVRKASLEGQVGRLNEQIAQLERQIEGLEAQQAGAEGELAILNDEVKGVEELYAQQLVDVRRFNEIKRERSRLEGEQGRLISAIAATRASIVERRVASGQAMQDFLSQVMGELQEAGQQIAELMQQRIAAEDRLARLEIRAPISGVIHESKVETVGGVIGAGEVLMLVVPPQSQLVVDAKFSPLDVDRLTPGQSVAVKLLSADVRTTPDLFGAIRTISPDLTTDPKTGQQYFLIRIDIAAEELLKLPQGFRLGPGMPAEIFAQTGQRTVWAYLVQPLTQQLDRAFRED